MRSRSLQKWILLVVALAIIAMTATAAFGYVDQFGGAGRPYAPYTAGPVVREYFGPYAPYSPPTGPKQIGHWALW